MKTTIHKYILPTTGRNDLLLPMHAEALTAQDQDGNAVLWARVNPDNKKVERTFYVVGTGWDLAEEIGSYVATFQQRGFVWHVFERLR